MADASHQSSQKKVAAAKQPGMQACCACEHAEVQQLPQDIIFKQVRHRRIDALAVIAANVY